MGRIKRDSKTEFLQLKTNPDYMHLTPRQQKQIEEFSGPSPEKATFYEVQEDDVGQRLDNFLIRICKGVPKSHLYRVIRAGELRVNKGRVDAQYRLTAGDLIRIPPIRIAKRDESAVAHVPTLDIPILYEDQGFMVVNKPAGIAVHGGSGVAHGVIERLRATRGAQGQSLELVHRLDRETSGVLVIAKKRKILNALQDQVRARSWFKFYQCLVMGNWPDALKEVDAPLLRTVTEQGDRRVYVNPDGAASLTKFRILKRYVDDSLGETTLLQAQLITGRTHQIRVHCQSKGHVILGDDKYGQFAINRMWTKVGLNRMFLHAAKLELSHPESGEPMCIEAPLPDALQKVLERLQPHEL